MKPPLILIAVLVLAGCANSTPPASNGTTATPQAPKRITSESVVKVAVQPAEIAGGAGQVIVRLTIDSGYHVNANPPTYPYLKATELKIAPANGISATAVNYPPALTRKFAFADEPLAVYEGEAELKAALRADRTATKGQQSIAAKLQVQACDEQVCYPPGTIDLQIPLTIK